MHLPSTTYLVHCGLHSEGQAPSAGSAAAAAQWLSRWEPAVTAGQGPIGADRVGAPNAAPHVAATAAGVQAKQDDAAAAAAGLEARQEAASAAAA